MKNTFISYIRENGFSVEASSANRSDIRIVAGSKVMLAKQELSYVSSCKLIARKEYEENSGKKRRIDLRIELVIPAKGKKKEEILAMCAPLDSESMKMLEKKGYNHEKLVTLACQNVLEVNPMRVVWYQKKDFLGTYGKEENDYTWNVCRIAGDAITERVVDNFDDFMDVVSTTNNAVPF